MRARHDARARPSEASAFTWPRPQRRRRRRHTLSLCRTASSSSKQSEVRTAGDTQPPSINNQDRSPVERHALETSNSRPVAQRGSDASGTSSPVAVPWEGDRRSLLTRDVVLDLQSSSYDAADAADNHLPDVGVLLLACATGVATGCGVVLFNQLIHAVQDDLVWSEAPRVAAFGAQYVARDPDFTSWRCLLVPPVVAGGAVAALRALMGGFEGDPRSVGTPPSGHQHGQTHGRTGRPSAPAWSRHGATAAIHSYLCALRSSARPYVKVVAAALTLGSGASLGPEGPSVELGKANAGNFARVARVQGVSVTTDLIAAGAGAGVAAGFGAPMSGVLFAVETVLLSAAARKAAAAAALEASGRRAQALPEDDEGALLIATVLVSCVFASMISLAGLGSEPAFHVPAYSELEVQELPLCIGVGLLCGAASSLLASASRSAERAFVGLRDAGVPALALPPLGGLACGSLAVLCPETTYQGFDNINGLMQLSEGAHVYTSAALFGLVAVKVVSTATCRGSGLVGGVYAPSIFVGAALGLAVRLAAGYVPALDGLLALPPAYALVGAAAMLAAYCRVPLTSVLLLFELTMDYTIVLPTLLTVGFARWSSARMDKALRPS